MNLNKDSLNYSGYNELTSHPETYQHQLVSAMHCTSHTGLYSTICYFVIVILHNVVDRSIKLYKKVNLQR